MFQGNTILFTAESSNDKLQTLLKFLTTKFRAQVQNTTQSQLSTSLSLRSGFQESTGLEQNTLLPSQQRITKHEYPTCKILHSKKKTL
jgi:uncharacterized coiled-coil protein SlyX